MSSRDVCELYDSANVVCEGTTKSMENGGDSKADIWAYMSSSKPVGASWIVFWISNDSKVDSP